MHILAFNWQDRTHPQSGGAEVHFHEIFGRIARMGHEVTLVCCGFDGAPPTEELDGIRVIRVGSRNTFNYSMRLWWKREGMAMRPDIVVDDINKIPFFTPRFVKRPILAIIHHFFGDSIFTEAGFLAGTYVKFFEDKVGKAYRDIPIAVVSESTREECLERGLSSKDLSVIYNGIDHTKFPMKVGPKDDVPRIISFGRLKKYKSIDHIIQAMAVVRETLPEARLDVIGTGDELGNLERLVDFHGLQDVITFHGFVSEERKAELLASAHVAVNASQKEGWGITNIESNASGTPVISADVPGLHDSVRDGVSGLLYEYGNSEQLAKLITRILVDHPERQRLSEGAVSWASTFTWERSAREMLDLCERTIADWRP